MKHPHPSTDVEEKGKSKILEMYAIAHYPTKFHPDYDLVLRAIDAERICKDLLTTQATTHQATLAEVVGEIRTMLIGIHNHDGNTASTRIAMRKAKALLTDIAAKHSIPLTDDKPEEV